MKDIDEVLKELKLKSSAFELLIKDANKLISNLYEKKTQWGKEDYETMCNIQALEKSKKLLK